MRAALLLALTACTPAPDDGVPIEPGDPIAGAAEGTLDLPIGVPLSGYTARAKLLSGVSRPDRRQSPYTTGFVPSAGVQTRPVAQALWLENGDTHLVLVKLDLVYSMDHLVDDLTQALEQATGESLDGEVIVATSHSHQAYGTFSHQPQWYLGSDRFNSEIYARLLDETLEVVLEAREAREPVAIGTGWARDWDPDDRVYRDRRGANDGLVIWDDDPLASGKDPHLNVLRVDRLDGTPMAMTFTFGIHGVAVGEDSPMLSTEAAGHVQYAIAEQFDAPVVTIHLQGSGGDASPAAPGHRFAGMERCAAHAVDPIMDLWAATPTSADPISLESATRFLPHDLDRIAVTRDGTVDWRYEFPNGPSDGVIYNEDGSLEPHFDEFRAPHGAMFCGREDPMLPGEGVGAQMFPYGSCVKVDSLFGLVETVFDLEEPLEAPLPASTRAPTTAALVGPLRTLQPDGTEVERPLLVGLFPGEPTAMLVEQFRRRSEAEAGHPLPLAIGYAQDHEGYLLLAEDWLQGGYEPNIGFWGPLFGEYILEGLLQTAKGNLGDGVHQSSSGGRLFDNVDYTDDPLPTLQPDRAPDAGTILAEAPADLWVPDGIGIDLALPAEIRRGEVVQLAWIGGDPMVDLPVVTVERLVDDGWVPLTTAAGRPVTDALPDVLLTTTPDPPQPVEGPQTHRWWAAWQAVSHVHDRAGLALGTYRLRVAGRTWVGEEPTWPWTTAGYEVVSDPFEVAPAQIQVEQTAAGFEAWIDAPASGFRMLDIDGSATGRNPVRGPLQVVVDGAPTSAEARVTPAGITRINPAFAPTSSMTVEDAYGNVGHWGLP